MQISKPHLAGTTFSKGFMVQQYNTVKSQASAGRYRVGIWTVPRPGPSDRMDVQV